MREHWESGGAGSVVAWGGKLRVCMFFFFICILEQSWPVQPTPFTSWNLGMVYLFLGWLLVASIPNWWKVHAQTLQCISHLAQFIFSRWTGLKNLVVKVNRQKAKSIDFLPLYFLSIHKASYLFLLISCSNIKSHLTALDAVQVSFCWLYTQFTGLITIRPESVLIIW